MDILLIGATGFLGSRILREALDRGHRVTALVRREGAELPAGVAVVVGDVGDPQQIARHAREADAVVASVSSRKEGDVPIDHAVETISQAVRLAGDGVRLLVVGGAGSLEVAPGTRLIDTADFPEAFRDEAEQQARALDVLRPREEVDWTYLSPAAEIGPGERTGRYRVGGDQLLVDEAGRSFITAEDFAVAVVDELETPRHLRRRFSVAY